MKKIFLILSILYVSIGLKAQNTFPTTGNVGIGTTTPLNKLVVSDGSVGFEVNPNAQLLSASGTYITCYNRATSNYADIIYDQGGTYTVFKAGGNVGIGITSPQEKLSVNGNIRAKEVLVETINWPDYVFDPVYKITPLHELKEFIDKNRHLPGVPSEKEILEKGQNVGEMSKLLLKKIEELTLYLIEKDKNEKRQQEEIVLLKEQVRNLMYKSN